MMSAVNPGVGAAPVSPADDLEFLKAQTKAMGEQLRAANTSIAGLKAEVPASGLVAMVDREKCIACGVCVEAYSVGAISVNDIVEVDHKKCTGRARCVAECPEDALSLRARS